MDYRCRLCSLGNSCTASGRSDPRETVSPNHGVGLRDFFFHSCQNYSSLLTFSYVSLSYFILAVPMRECLLKTLVHVFHICMGTVILRLYNYTCTMCIRSEKVEILTH